MKIGIVGAGIAGRLLAWRLAKLGYPIELFDRQKQGDESACSFAAAGILSPLAELEMAEQDIYHYGTQSMTLYPQWLKELSQPVFFRQTGSLVTAHGTDKVELDHFYRLIKRKIDLNTLSKDTVERIQIRNKEPELTHLGDGLFIPSEGHIDAIGLMQSLAIELGNLSNVDWHHASDASTVENGQISVNDKKLSFDWVFDCRGLGAKDTLSLRAVRGELLWLYAPDVEIKHLTRLIHPRYRIYVVPRPDSIYLIGATEIESEDYSPVSVRSSLELLSAAYSVHRGFGEARVIKSVVNCRPALSDNLPLVKSEAGLTQINGLYRHGILIAPAVVEKAIKEFEFAIKELGKINYAH